MVDRDALGRSVPEPGRRDSPRRQAVAVIRALEQVGTSVVQKIALDTVANLRRAAPEGGTPVDTGWARANWIASVGSSASRPVGEPTESGVRQAEVAQSQGEGAVLGYQFGMGSVFITNNVDYITRLNEGSSKQAPAGFVQAAIREAVRGLRF